MNKLITIFTTAVLLLSMNVSADPGMDKYNKAMADVQGIYSSLDGLEVSGTGYIGYGYSDQLKINPIGDKGTFAILSFGFYDVQLDAGRDARKLLKGCKTGWNGSNCKVNFKAELSVDGRSVTYIIYEVSDLIRE